MKLPRKSLFFRAKVAEKLKYTQQDSVLKRQDQTSQVNTCAPMNNENKTRDDLASILKAEGINIRKYENILKNIKFLHKNGYPAIIFPHKYLYELYKIDLKKIVEYIFKGNIVYIVNEVEKISKFKNNDCFISNEFIFDNFISGNKNNLTLEICKEIAWSNHVKYNPIILYGERSSGKTHIVNSIINNIKNRKAFIYDCFEINHNLSPASIPELYSNIIKNDLVIIENINEINIEQTLNLLLEKTIDYFYSNKKQIILTYTGNRINLSDFSESLRDRINSGLTLKIFNPDLDVRIKFAKKFCSDKKINISNDNIFTISSNCDNIRTIKGILLNLTALHDNSDHVDPGTIDKIFEDKQEKTRVDFKSILKTVSSTTGHSTAEILNMSRGREVSRARQICMYLCKHHLNWSYPQIGLKFSGRDHSTVIYSVKKIEQLKKVNKEMNKMLSDLFKMIRTRP